MKKVIHSVLFSLLIGFSLTTCRPDDEPFITTPLHIESIKIDAADAFQKQYGVAPGAAITIVFNLPVDLLTLKDHVGLIENGIASLDYEYNTPSPQVHEADARTVIIRPTLPFKYLTRYNLLTTTGLRSIHNTTAQSNYKIEFVTQLDTTDKKPRISDEALLDTVQRYHFKYFWDLGHPVSGLALERNTSGDLVTSGGSGFGIMAIITGIERGFINRAEGFDRIATMVDFLHNKTDKYHGAFPHWLHGVTGATIPFSTNDNGADLVETSFLMAGLLSAREYFSENGEPYESMRQKINALWNGVEWDWFTKGDQDELFWHWSPDKAWAMNLPIRGWNECLVTYVLAASSPTHAIDPQVYHQGWARNGNMKNGNNYYGHTLPFGPDKGGPLFFAHYSFMGIDPRGLTDQYGDYHAQVMAHTRINHAYCVDNPRNYYGYGEDCWGLTAGDIPDGYTASAPNNDRGVIGPTAALASMPYTPEESMRAMRFYYYTLGDKLWGPYGFYDGFSLSSPWFARSTLAIDQGPIIVMIENHRSGLLWNLLMGCPEIQIGMTKLGFQSPHF